MKGENEASIMTGISREEFDRMFEPKGIPINTTITLAGPMGSGKTTFMLNYLVKGAVEYDQPGIFVSLEEPIENILKDYGKFRWGLKNVSYDNILLELAKDKKLIMIDCVKELYSGKSKPSYVISDIQELEKKMGEKGYLAIGSLSALEAILVNILNILKKEYNPETVRVAFDSLPAYIFNVFSEILPSHEGEKSVIESEARRKILSLRYKLETNGATTIFASEALDERTTKLGIEEFISRGYIYLGYETIGSRKNRYLTVIKMRGRKHKMNRMAFKIDSKEGIVILEEVF